MIDAKLLQSFMSDIEMLRSLSSSSANSSASSAGAKSAPYDPFTEILAKTLKALEAEQLQGDISGSEAINPGLKVGDLLSVWRNAGINPSGINSGLQNIGANVFNTWFNQGNNRSGSVTSDDINKLFPELSNLNSMLGSQ